MTAIVKAVLVGVAVFFCFFGSDLELLKDPEGTDAITSALDGVVAVVAAVIVQAAGRLTGPRQSEKEKPS